MIARKGQEAQAAQSLQETTLIEPEVYKQCCPKVAAAEGAIKTTNATAAERMVKRLSTLETLST
jgi:hypothetical protein